MQRHSTHSSVSVHSEEALQRRGEHPVALASYQPCGTLLWTAREAAKALAISERKLWQLTKDGLVRAVKMGRSVRYSPDDLRRFIEEMSTAA
jgi:excisionase family DNA binding protein